MKKQIITVIAIIVGIILIALGATYAWLVWSGTATNTNTITAGNLAFTYNDGSDISLTGAMPVTDATAKEETIGADYTSSIAERTITITNSGDIAAYWYLYLDNSSTIPAAQISIAYKLSTETWANAKVSTLAATPALHTSCTSTISNLGLATSGTRKLIGCGPLGTATADKTVTYNMRIYLNDTATESNISGKTATIKLTPYGTQSAGR